MNNILSDLQWRYAVKKFDSHKKISKKQVDLLAEAFNLTPSSYGLQPIRLIIITNDTLKKALGKASYHQKQVTSCSHLLVICYQSDFSGKDIDRFTEIKLSLIPDKNDEIIEYGEILKSRFADKPVAEIDLWAREQAFIALGNLLTVCAVEKIDSCPMGGFIPKEVSQILKLEEKGLTPAALLPVGYRANDDMHQYDPKVRRPLEEMVFYLF